MVTGVQFPELDPVQQLAVEAVELLCTELLLHAYRWESVALNFFQVIVCIVLMQC
jgi:hypothetical protein